MCKPLATSVVLFVFEIVIEAKQRTHAKLMKVIQKCAKNLKIMQASLAQETF